MSSTTSSQLPFGHANGKPHGGKPRDGTPHADEPTDGKPDDAPDPQRRRETDLFIRAQAGDRGAFGQLAISCQDRLYNAIVRLVGDREEARELAQETFVKALDKIGTFRGESKPYTWLFRIGLNLALSHLRSVKRHRTFSLDAPANRHRSGDQAAGLAANFADQIGVVPEDQLERREQQQQVVAALGRVDPEYRAVLIMRDVDDMDYQDMADTLDVPLGTLKSRLFRARKALREELLKVMKD